MRAFAILLVALAALPQITAAQIGSATPPLPTLADTIFEPATYPVGDAVGVYRAVLDLLYLEGAERPSVIVMHDSAEGRSEGPCAFSKCLKTWSHLSKIDTATLLRFARMGRRRPAIVNFGYPIPIVFLSYDDVHRMIADGNEVLRAAHKQLGSMDGFWVEFQRKFPGAWGVTTLTKVGFNSRHTEALVQVYQWCGSECRSHEILFLKRTKSAWRVAERIPSDAETGYPAGNLRYVGPTTGAKPEIIAAPGSGWISEATARAGVYRAVLDSLYSFASQRPRTIVFTDRLRPPYTPFPAHLVRIDSALLRKNIFLDMVRAPLDTRLTSSTPIVRLSRDSIESLEKAGAVLDKEFQTGDPLFLAFSKRYPGAWGMVSLTRIAFNGRRTEALVYSNHSCGVNCENGDTWHLRRTGQRWRIVERIPRQQSPSFEIDPLRYLGAGANPKSYRPRRAHGVVTNVETQRPVPFLAINIRSTRVNGSVASESVIRTDSAGRFVLTDLPLWGSVVMTLHCPDNNPDHYPLIFATVEGTPGIDTTMNVPIDYRHCIDVPPVVPVNTLTGAQAFIGPDEARFVFPHDSTKLYRWDVPVKGQYEGGAEYMWEVRWRIGEGSAGKQPYLLWLIKRWKKGGPRKGSLAKMIDGLRLEPMIDCLTCDGAVYADPETDYKKVFATVEKNGDLVFTIRGADAVRRIFPTVPDTVSFSKTVRQTPLPQYGPGDVEESLAVKVSRQNPP